MSGRRNRPRLAPPPLPERRMSPWEERLSRAVPYLSLVALLLFVAAFVLRRFSGEEIIFGFPRGEWALALRRFLHWGILPALVLTLAVWTGLVRRGLSTPTMAFSRVSDAAALGPGIRGRLVDLPLVLRIGAVALWLFALMGPQVRKRHMEEESSKGIDIMVVLDVSGSMRERDLYPNRLEAAKKVIDDFVAQRKNDRIGLVLFGRQAYWYSPLTLDHAALRSMLAKVRLGIIDPQGTAIGDALGTALNRLRKVDETGGSLHKALHRSKRSKVIILLTDGDNNAGILRPRKAAEYARTLGVKVYTILMGYAGGGKRRSVFSRYPVNPKLLEEIATTTGGTPYLAADTRALRNRFHRILDSLEKDVLPARFEETRMPVQQWFVAAGLVLLVIESLLSLTVLRRFP